MEKAQSTYPTKHRFWSTEYLMVLIFAFAMVLAGCGGDTSTGTNGGSNGGGNGGGNGNGNNNGGGGNGIGTEPTFANVQEIFNESCGGSGCHIGGRTNGVRLDSYTNVIESEGASYGELVIQAGDAEASPLVDKIEPNPDICCRMPQGGPYLSDERIEQIKTWINNGAENN